MAILSNKGRVIPSLENYPNPVSGDLLIVQDLANNQTKNISFSQLAIILAEIIQDVPINFSSPSNRFTGSFLGGTFKGVSFSGSTGAFQTSLNVLNGSFLIDSSQFSAINFPTMTFGTTGDPISFISDVDFQQNINVDGVATSTGGFSGDLTGNVIGDIYSPTTQLVLDNGTGLPKNAQFYGTSSYAHRAGTSNFADVAGTTLSCVTHTTFADQAIFATSSLSASYASQSRSSSYLIYNSTHTNNGTASYAMNSDKARYADGAFEAFHSVNADFAETASFLQYNGIYNGSASYALTASYLAGGAPGPHFIGPHVVFSSTASIDATPFNCTAIPNWPVNANTVILDCSIFSRQTDPGVYDKGNIFIGTGASGINVNPQYQLGAFWQPGSDQRNGTGGQGIFPLNAAHTFYYQCTSRTQKEKQVTDSPWTIRVIGYYI